MQLHLTLRHFPRTRDLKGSCSLPFACLIQPFASQDSHSDDSIVNANQIARCSKCFGYINKYCTFGSGNWRCILCGHENVLSTLKSCRYLGETDTNGLPELADNYVEAKCPLAETLPTQLIDGNESSSIEAPFHLEVQPIHIALIDVSCSEDFIELVQSTLSAVLEALPPTTRLGIVTFSTKLGLYDVSGKAPSVKFVHIIESGTESPTALDLQDALSLDSLAPSLSTHKESIARAIDLLTPEQSQISEDSLDPFDETTGGSRGFGPALQAVLRLLGNSRGRSVKDEAEKDKNLEGLELTGAKILAFLSGPSNFGRGAVEVWWVPREGAKHSSSQSLKSLSDSPDKYASSPFLANQPKWHANPDSRAFYEEAGTAAASLGVSINLFVASSSETGMDYMTPLVENSGGCMSLYPQQEDAAMPQDVYRHLTAPQALNGLLRVRTSSEFQAVKGYGQLTADKTHENLYYVLSCESATAFAFDFDYSQTSGFSETRSTPPYVQIAYQYDRIFQKEMTEAGENSMANGSSEHAQDAHRCVLERRLRILTLPMRVANAHNEVYQNADPEAILAILMHKIGRAASTNGIEEARSLLQDWLVLACSAYNSQQPEAKSSAKHVNKVDTEFKNAPILKSLPHLVYGLLRSILLATSEEISQDKRASVCHSWSTLPPDLLAKAIYPSLVAYSNPDTPALPPLGLSRASLIAAEKPIFFLDSLTSLLVYYSAEATKIPFPPPQGSALRKKINSVRQSRRPLATLKMLRGGVDDIRPFLAALIEDPEVDEIGKVITPSFIDFIEKLRMQTWQYMESHQAKK